MSLSRLLKPRSICAIGGREADYVIRQCQQMGFAGPIYPVHPSRPEMAGLPCYRSVDELPAPPDAAFIGVRRELAVEMTRALAARGAGGVVCYASGFSEAGADGEALQQALAEAAGAMPLLGPNCYGFVNYLDGAPLWPDQHGGARVDRGVAILSQSGNIALTLTMNRRALPLAMVVTLGNRACLGVAALLDALLDEARISAVGMVLETLEDAPALAVAAAKARDRRVPLAACKLGQSADGARIALSHTAALAGKNDNVEAFLRHVGIPLAPSLPALLETLKVLHTTGPLPGRNIASLSCSGGEAALVADALSRYRLQARPLTPEEGQRVGATLNELVAISNPLDYHTFIWSDEARLTQTFAAMAGCGFDLSLLVIDPPRGDRCNDEDWRRAMDAFAAALAQTGAQGAVLATLPESLTEPLAQDLAARGIVPLAGVDEGLAAIEAAADIGEHWAADPPPAGAVERQPPPLPGEEIILNEWETKQALAAAGLSLPPGELARDAQSAAGAAQRLRLPVVVKAVSSALTHKSEQGAVRLNLRTPAAVATAAADLLPLSGQVLVERMVEDGVAEIIMGVNRDPQVGLTLLLGSGGELVELARDRVVLLMPASREQVAAALARLKVSRLLDGFRGRPAGDREALIETALALQRFAIGRAEVLLELEVNPVIARPAGRGAVAVDALMRLRQAETGPAASMNKPPTNSIAGDTP